MSELVVLICEARDARCGGASAAGAERDAAVRDVFARAHALLKGSGFEAPSPVIVLDARLDGVAAITVVDAAAEGLTAYAGRPAILFGKEPGAETDLDVVVHELVHVWLRARGADEARWRLDGGRANHESAMVHEGLADFVTAALTRDPVIAEGLASNPPSLRPVVRCPEDLTGSEGADSRVVSSALWRLCEQGGQGGQGPDETAQVLAAIREGAPGLSRGLEDLVASVKRGLRTPLLAARWDELVADHGLQRCDEPLPISHGSISSRGASFLAAGTQRLGVAEVTGPLHFSAVVATADAVRVSARSSQRDTLGIAWQARAADGRVLTAGQVPLGGWPSQFAWIELPPESHTLVFGFVSSAPFDVTYNGVGVFPVARGPRSLAAGSLAPAPVGAPSGCGALGLSGQVDLVLALLIGLFAWRRRTRSVVAPVESSFAKASRGVRLGPRSEAARESAARNPSAPRARDAGSPR